MNLFFLLLSVLGKTVKKYHGDKVYRYEIENTGQQQLLSKLVDQYHLDLWTENIIGPVDVHIPKSLDSKIKQKLNGVKHKVYVQDLQKSIDQERKYTINNMAKFKDDYTLSEERIFSDYQDTLVYQSFLETLPGAEKIYLGSTFLGAEISGVKFGSGDKQIVFHGGIHAREWIGPATVVYIANAISKGTDPDSTYLLKEFTFHVIPVLNVDGYDYTRNPKGDRMNRKNREPNGGCIGTDPNRNFPFAWSKPGASGDPCSDAYYGPSPGSSKEVQAITSYIKSLSNVVSYIDFHAYSQLFMFPFGHDCNYKNKDEKDLMNASNAAVKAIKGVNGLRFKNGASGSSVDYIYQELGVKYSFAVELRPNSFFGGGFLLPAKYIVPAGKETLAGVIAAWKYVAAH
ncbi:carbamoyl-phosphate synthase (glutamine-hydrolyzing) cpa2 [Boothiomyces sp. JEL0866]|nr:carbamoyl-phosphate synthase (glutamine-hydrolyzing) cpa2 [Boothiomyces sp. JEL0866]